jgi:hypothetical protein
MRDEGSLPFSTIRDAFADFAKPPDDEKEPHTLEASLFEPDDVPVPADTVPLRPKKRKKRKWDELLRPSDRHLRSASTASLDAYSTVTTDLAIQRRLLDQLCAASASRLTVRRVLKDEERREAWIAAIKSEIDSLFEGGTLVPEKIDRSKPYQLIRTTMQLKMKMKDDNTLDKLKARCCAMGNLLGGLISDTYSPTISALAIAVVHQIAVIDEMHTCSVDTVGAYLYQPYPMDATPLYVTLEPSVCEALNLDPQITYRVRKYIYGLPDSGRAYYQAYSSHLEAHGYKRTISDPCLFVKVTPDSRTYVFCHVDDTFVASTCKDELKIFQDVVKLKFKITVEEDVSSYLGIHIERLSDGSVQLTQPKLLNQLFEEFHPEDMPRTDRVTAPQRLPVSQSQAPTAIDTGQYLHLLGILLYLTKSRPDIATAVSFAATHATAPTLGDYHELLHCVKYLYNTREKGLILRRNSSPGAPLTLRCYVDASYLTHSDSKSHTGYCMSFGELGAFYSKSSKQTLVTTSSTHAEMRALYQLVIDIVYTVNLCSELHRPLQLPAIVMEDNQPVLDLSAELTGRTKKCKHFLMLVNYIREHVDAGLILLRKVDTRDNWADLLTKILVGQDFYSKSHQILGYYSA